ncbi:MAG: CRISPR-associated protein Cas4 [Ectothiorhodospiraceae bacterium]|nr:CRISPR-associated protein Cas4 [Ectothiorhodospiraceae bacterium]
MEETDHIPLSALQHYLYCPRQCALIHVERQWAENRLTAEGGVVHGRVDTEAQRRRDGVRYVTSLPLTSERLGLIGVADLLELDDRNASRRITPVEYKRGKPKGHRADEVQLCAQALCLEEMFQVDIPSGALYYDQRRRRTSVAFDDELRALTEHTALAARAMILNCRTPPPHYSTKLCGSCSLAEICQPKRLSRKTRVQSWLKRTLE